MQGSAWRNRKRFTAVTVSLCAASLAGCGSSGGGHGPAPFLAVLSAMPVELAPNLASADVTGTVTLEDRDFREGTLEGLHVVMGMTRIGLVNASTASNAVLDAFPVTGVIVSGVAKSSLRVGDVTVADTWVADDGGSYHADPTWLALAQQLTAQGALTLTHCSTNRPGSAESPICVDYDPVLVVGGVGHSSDPFGGSAAPCFDNGNPVFGCDPGSTAGGAMSHTSAARARAASEPPSPNRADDASTTVQDMETAAIAAQATARGLPFIAFRATSDDAPNPIASLDEFFTYYDLSSLDASDATRAFLRKL